MNSTLDLRSVIAALAAIDREGWLSDLEHDIAETARGPADDLARFPHHRFDVERFAKLAERLLRLPLDDCRDAAREELLPWTRRRTALAIIAEYATRIDGSVVARSTADKLQRERAGRRGA